MRRSVVLASLGLACGDNLAGDGLPLAPAADLFVVAHPDDDLLLMQPDVRDALDRGTGVTTVYVTAGNGDDGGVDAAERRYAGVRSAYAYAAGLDDSAWRCGWIDIGRHTAEHCRLPAQNVSLVFLGYPDGGKEGEFPDSLLNLSRGAIAGADTVATRSTHYTRDGLVDTLADVVRTLAPARVHTLDFAASHGRDHVDHEAVAALTVVALAAANSHSELLAYRGYGIGDEPANKLGPILDASLAMLLRYEACADGCAPCGDACKTIDDQHVTWISRRYAIGTRARAGGHLRIDNQCLTDNGTLASCNIAPTWTRDSAGELRARDVCLTAADDGTLSTSPCLGGASRRFTVDDEGHIFAGIAPAIELTAVDGMLWCLGAAQSRAHLERCARLDAPTWELAPTAVETARTTLGFATSGRDVRLGDLTGDHRADLCTVDATQGLLCAPGLGNGQFDAATRIDSAAQPLAIDPRSLVLGDVDGDGHLDACGRDAAGVLCATHAQAFTAERWTATFSATTELATTSASLAALDEDGDGTAEVCGVDQAGVVCAKPGVAAPPAPMSTWPADDAVVFLADLDADGAADWCAATDTGPACALAADAALSTDGTPWGYASATKIDIMPANTATVAFGDIDGDGRADTCVPRGDEIVCARSQGRGFGPRTVILARLPNQSVASALWLGDLDGDGRADPCADTGTTIACAVQP
jgi:LmbE family N-acetylglucosaminyl deacetylase